ncbi:MAG: VWA domain-containing protein [Deltaproteobacteria bacterium]|nr:VWA domain-containing protein [Deltaproteobacteria bacterium]
MQQHYAMMRDQAPQSASDFCDPQTNTLRRAWFFKPQAIGKVPIFAVFVLLSFFFAPLPPTQADAATDFPEVMIILDGSGSMWGTAGEKSKIKAAQEVLHQLIPFLPPEVKIGLTVYGHRRKGSCDDIEIMLPAGSDNRSLLLKFVDGINPKGKTPIADSIKTVVSTLKNNENETTIILVSDGEETCSPDPCGVVRELKTTGIRFILQVVGFDVNQKQKEELACLATAGGGRYFDAADAAGLLAALKTVEQEVVAKVEFEKAKTTVKKKKSGLGKLRVTFPSGSEKSLAHIRIIRKQDGKTIKNVDNPSAESIHPLLSGAYDIVLGYANSNNQKPSEIEPLPISIAAEETTDLKLGSLMFNVAEAFDRLPASSVTLRRDDGRVVLETPENGNNYYFFTSKPLPPGCYSFTYFYKTLKAPVIAATGIVINPDAESVLTLDSGIKIKKHDQNMTGFDLISLISGRPVLQVQRRWDNDYPLWESFALPPGNYALHVYLKGMEEPLPAVDEIIVHKGELLEIDTGL